MTQPATQSMKPNVILILDDSGSMGRQFTPDYVSSNANTGTQKNCFDTYDTGNTITAVTEECLPTDPPAFSPDFNISTTTPRSATCPRWTTPESNATA